MKIVNAIWEEKNTGMRTCEILCEGEDSFDFLSLSELEKQYDFMVIKIPVGSLNIVHQLEDDGYKYLEIQLNISFEVSQTPSILERWQSKLTDLDYTHINERKGLDIVLKEVQRGMFKSDRFYLDPFWQKDISSRRYINWICAMYEGSETDFYLMQREGQPIGFFTLKKIAENTGYCPIAGIFNDYQNQGFFLSLAYLWLKVSSESGYKRLKTAISTNNTTILSFLSRIFSFKVDAAFVVLRKVTNQ